MILPARIERYNSGFQDFMLLCTNTQQYNEDGSLIFEVWGKRFLRNHSDKIDKKTVFIFESQIFHSIPIRIRLCFSLYSPTQENVSSRSGLRKICIEQPSGTLFIFTWHEISMCLGFPFKHCDTINPVQIEASVGVLVKHNLQGFTTF